MSRLPELRRPADAGVPVWIVGKLERHAAFALVVLKVAPTLIVTLLLAWMGAKLAASWQRFPVKSDKAGRDTRAGTLAALITGIVSVSLGVLVGLLTRWAIHSPLMP